MVKNFAVSAVSLGCTKIFFARAVMVQKRNNIVAALDSAELIFTQNATLVTSAPASSENIFPIIRKSGAPGW